ncbi:hypothetical protein SKPI104516_08215 [Skermania piniformis]
MRYARCRAMKRGRIDRDAQTQISDDPVVIQPSEPKVPAGTVGSSTVAGRPGRFGS